MSDLPTPFILLCERCGLSPRDAAGYLDTTDELIALWSRDHLSCPDHVIGQLRLLYRQISAVAEAAMRDFVELSRRQGAIAEVNLQVAADDEAARQLGLPCIGAHRAALGLVIARAHGTRFVLVG